MARILLGTGNVTWNANERRSDRYGSIRLTNNNAPDTEPEHNILLDAELHNLQGRKGKLIAKVIEPVKSPHMGDDFRNIRPTTPELNEEVLFGEGLIFIESYRPEIKHEPSVHEIKDAQAQDALNQAFRQMGIKTRTPQAPADLPFDVVGLQPQDGRPKDWMDIKAFYRTHLSKVELYFETTNEN